MDSKQLRQMLDKHDDDNSGQLAFEEFLHIFDQANLRSETGFLLGNFARDTCSHSPFRIKALSISSTKTKTGVSIAVSSALHSNFSTTSSVKRRSMHFCRKWTKTKMGRSRSKSFPGFLSLFLQSTFGVLPSSG